ncbi:hypothetical protein BRADI_4g07075v3 [Brachypodium distachyon]|uniref:Uncharacterized protein n=1 Tax=Brachypodium distachyon TaxID=15368 RepID=A0A2K2CKY2_BRADI|nr:hypothetical protein BRADI_4g07075v3 [Brachypodium distachyon]
MASHWIVLDLYSKALQEAGTIALSILKREKKGLKIQLLTRTKTALCPRVAPVGRHGRRSVVPIFKASLGALSLAAAGGLCRAKPVRQTAAAGPSFLRCFAPGAPGRHRPNLKQSDPMGGGAGSSTPLAVPALADSVPTAGCCRISGGARGLA